MTGYDYTCGTILEKICPSFFMLFMVVVVVVIVGEQWPNDLGVDNSKHFFVRLPYLLSHCHHHSDYSFGSKL